MPGAAGGPVGHHVLAGPPEGLGLGQAAGSPRLLPGAAMLCSLQMSYELWRDLEGESEGDGQGRKPEIGNVFLMDRGGLEHGGQWAVGSSVGWQLARGGRRSCGADVGCRRCRGAAVGCSWALALIADTDYVTALCSQVVYEGLVDDTFRIKCGRWPGGRWGSTAT